MAEEKERKDSYTKLFNPILEALCKSDLNASELKIVFFVIRCTYGWNKKKFAMSKSFIAEGTNIDRRNVGKIMKGLVDKNVLIDYGIEKDSRIKVYGLNKHYSQWGDVVSNASGNLDDICASETPLSMSSEMPVSIVANETHKKDKLKRHIKKEKEKKCSQKDVFFLDENGNWQQKKADEEDE